MTFGRVDEVDEKLLLGVVGAIAMERRGIGNVPRLMRSRRLLEQADCETLSRDSFG